MKGQCFNEMGYLPGLDYAIRFHLFVLCLYFTGLICL